ncbi:Eco57I restriction-modification methylase domain-containing protein [Mangrovicoccus sp. HB161399]|uniref:Eco57I restriction-modification methylase domain-containing protein n=1 Tax=Mangrovicoccus sp. HB161399 TaxID=2720392 RepID=UPI001557304F|nr:N-6 DNA methylase [Mangrovicoccus sp. HB161399]
MSRIDYQPANAKLNGAYFTPDAVVRSLVSWAVQDETDLMLDPSCGDGRFLAGHVNSVGVEQDPASASVAKARAAGALVHEGDFFRWAANTELRFDCAAGNPPFIRYQLFKGETRAAAQALCRRSGAQFSGLASSWAPFLVAAGSLVKPGGRMAFVVPAEIGHAPYAAPLLEWLASQFAHVQLIAVRDKLFPELSEDCWLLYAEGRGESTHHLSLTRLSNFSASNAPPKVDVEVPLEEWRETWNRRLRPFLLSPDQRQIYLDATMAEGSRRLSDIATAGIGYVSGANNFFHLRPSEAKAWGIPRTVLTPAIRNARSLPSAALKVSDLRRMERDDAPMLLLNLRNQDKLPASVRRYLDSTAGKQARTGFKCRNRAQWYAVPDVRIPDYFLAYMSGRSVALVENEAKATCTNSLHAVTLHREADRPALAAAHASKFFQLSCELEGHPLGGGMLKLEPREAARIVIPTPERIAALDDELIGDAISELQRWRHYAD